MGIVYPTVFIGHFVPANQRKPDDKASFFYFNISFIIFIVMQHLVLALLAVLFNLNKKIL